MPPTKNGKAKQKYRFSFRKVVARSIKRSYNVEKYCVRCGNAIYRTYENNDLWNKIKKCSDCSILKRPQNPEERYCSCCGKKFHEFDVSIREKDWNSWYLCSECKKIKLDIICEIEISCLELADRAYREFLQEKFFVKKDKNCKDLPERFKEIVPEIIDALEDFLEKLLKLIILIENIKD